jgi:hypothetical protein
MPSNDDNILLRVRPSLPDQDDVTAARGPLMFETALSSLHSLSGNDGTVSFDMGLAEGKIGFFVRGSRRAAALAESQLYAQFPDAEIEPAREELFALKPGEIVVTADLAFTDPEVFPIRRYPQFTDASTRQNVDTVAGITSSLVRYPKPGMRGLVQLVVTPAPSKLVKRAKKFLPYLGKGMAKRSEAYAMAWTNVHLTTGWKRLLLWPVDVLMGGWRMWFSKLPPISISLLSGDEITPSSSPSDEPTKISSRNHDREDSVQGAADKLSRLMFQGNLRVSVIAPAVLEAEARAKVDEIAGAFRPFSLPGSNGLRIAKMTVSQALPSGFSARPFLLSAEEVATLWHVPSIMVKTPNMDWVISKKLEPPVNLPVEGITDEPENLTVLGESVFQGQRLRFGIRPDDRRRHIYVIGKTGMGKSTILENMIYSDVAGGKGVAVIDPHGDLIEACLKFIPKDRTNDVMLFEPSDKDYAVSFNMFEVQNPDQKPLIASGMMSIFTKMWPEAFSGRMEYILRNTLIALLDNEGTTMLGILRMFADDAFRKKIVANCTEPVVKTFWEVEYPSWSDKYRTEAVAAIQNKIGQLLTTPIIRNIVGQVKSTLDIRHAMDTGKIVLVNLSKGKIGEDTSAFLGSMLVTKFQIDAMSRADIAEKDRRDFYLYVDEFQNFATKSFATILSEARKYRLALTIAHQYVGQLTLQGGDTALRDAVFGNVGSMVSFQVGSDDAEDLSQQFEEMVSVKDILSLPKYHAYVRLMIDGIPSKPFSVSTLPPPRIEIPQGRVDQLRALSRERYAQKKSVVEERIMRWAAGAQEAQVAAKTATKQAEKEEEEKKKARAKKMTLEQYRAWRDRELWLNLYNSIRKKQFLGETLTPEETKQMAELAPKLEATGGIPPVSKTLLDEAKKKGIDVSAFQQ